MSSLSDSEIHAMTCGARGRTLSPEFFALAREYLNGPLGQMVIDLDSEDRVVIDSVGSRDDGWIGSTIPHLFFRDKKNRAMEGVILFHEKTRGSPQTSHGGSISTMLDHVTGTWC
jgi:hypothetical protein